ncbi:MAG: alpha/beta fold hydrolase [Thermomicrobiaceae bacterium]
MKDLMPGWATSRFELNHVTVDGEVVPYLVGGDGPALLMIHGMTLSLDWWQLVAPDLARHFCVYLIDLPGFGRLGHLESTDSIQEFADWLHNFMEEAGLDRAHLLGLSLGAIIALQVTADHPERVDRLILLAPAMLRPRKSLFSHGLGWLRVLPEVPRWMIPLALRDASWADLQAVWHSGQDLLEEDVRDRLSAIRATTLVAVGNNDPILSISQAEALVEKLPDARLVVLPGAGHMPMISDPGRLNQEILRFLRSDSCSGSV